MMLLESYVLHPEDEVEGRLLANSKEFPEYGNELP